MSVFERLLTTLGILEPPVNVCGCGRVVPVTASDFLVGAECANCDAYRCLICQISNVRPPIVHRGYTLDEQGCCSKVCREEFEKDVVLPWKLDLDECLAEEEEEARVIAAALRVALMRRPLPGHLQATAHLISDTYDTWEDCEWDIRLQAAARGVGKVWELRRHHVHGQSGNYVYKRWYYTAVVGDRA